VPGFPPHDGKPPSWLHGVSRREFRRLAFPLVRAGLLKVTDTDALAMLARSLTEYKRVDKILADPKLLPDDRYKMVCAQSALIKTCLTLFSRFGLTPYDRSSFKLDAPTADDEKTAKYLA
jgi:P27 family predicted phage terminase small subunit